MEILLTMSLQGAVLIAALLVLRRLFEKRMSPAVLYALWLLPAVRLLLPGNLESAFSFLNFVSPAAQRRVADSLTDPVIAAPAFSPAAAPVQNVPAISPALETVPEQTVVVLSAAQVFAVVWLIGAAAVLLIALWKNFTFVRDAKRGAVRVDVECPLPVYLSEFVSAPCLCGVLRPVILVTDRTLQRDTALALALRHELEHYRAGDRFWALLRLACCAVHWFNPLVWAAAKASVQDCERACDHRVLKGADQSEREAYGMLLLSYLKAPAARYSLLCASSPMDGGKRSLRARIALIGKKPTTKKAAALVLAVCVVLTCLVACTGRNTQEAYLRFAKEAGKAESVSDIRSSTYAMSGKTLENYLNGVQWEASGDSADQTSGNLLAYFTIDTSRQDRNGMYGTLTVLHGDDGAYYASVFLQNFAGTETERTVYEIDEDDAWYAWALGQLSTGRTVRSALPGGGEMVLVSGDPALGQTGHWLFRSDDGADYTYVESDIDRLAPQYVTQFYFVNKKVGFAAFAASVLSSHTPPHLFRTENGGKTWKEVYLTDDGSIFGGRIREISFENGKNGRVTVDYGENGETVSKEFTTTDSGKTWSAVTSGGPAQSADTAAASIAPYDANGDGVLETREFPIPTGETFGLSGDDAVLYSAAAQVTLQGMGSSLDQDTMLILTSLTVLGEYDGENGEKNYVCIRRRHFYYDLGEDVRNTSYDIGTATNPACITIAADGSLVGIRETYDGADNTERIRELCGPLTDVADALIHETEVPGESRTLAPQKAEELVGQYLAYYFPEL